MYKVGTKLKFTGAHRDRNISGFHIPSVGQMLTVCPRTPYNSEVPSEYIWVSYGDYASDRTWVKVGEVEKFSIKRNLPEWF